MADKRPDYIITTEELAHALHVKEEDLRPLLDRNEIVFLPGNKKGVLFSGVRKHLISRGFSYNFKVVSVLNMRGGIGKTTTVISAAARAYQYGLKTVILDMDPQGSASLAFNKEPVNDDLIFTDIWDKSRKEVGMALKKIEEYLYILPSSLDNGILDSQLDHPEKQKTAVKNVCSILREIGFDLVFIDCPPSLSTAVVSSICASDVVVIPVCGDKFSIHGLDLALEEINAITKSLHIAKPEIRILFTKFDKRIKSSFQSYKELQKMHKKELLPFVIQTSTDFINALNEGKTVFSSSSRTTAKTDYDKFLRSIIDLQ